MEHGSFHQAWAYQRDRAVFVAGGGVPTREEAATWARWQFAGVVEEGGPAAEAPEATGRLQRQFFPEEVEGGVERTEGFEAVDLYGVTEEEWGVPFAALAAGAEAVAETREAVDVEDEEVASPEADDVEDEEEDEGVGEEDEEELEQDYVSEPESGADDDNRSVLSEEEIVMLMATEARWNWGGQFVQEGDIVRLRFAAPAPVRRPVLTSSTGNGRGTFWERRCR
jgi:hypothetical protein